MNQICSNHVIQFEYFKVLHVKLISKKIIPFFPEGTSITIYRNRALGNVPSRVIQDTKMPQVYNWTGVSLTTMDHRKISNQTILLLSLADNATLLWYNSLVLRAVINLAYYLITFSKLNMFGFI